MEDTFEFDIYAGTLISNCELNPSDVTLAQKGMYWLCAVNNKYPKELCSPEKFGKWMLFVPPDQVDETWNKIKEAVKKGNLWDSIVSTSEASDKSDNHAIMIYTKNYSDLQDVINVLDYLETSGIKPPHTTIKYKTDEQTRAGIYRGCKQKPWIYTSDTIRVQNSDVPNWRATCNNSSSPSCSSSGQHIPNSGR